MVFADDNPTPGCAPRTTLVTNISISVNTSCAFYADTTLEPPAPNGQQGV